MRYLISIFVVLALALLPAMGQAGCPSDKELLADYDSELPVWGSQYIFSNCDSLSWTFAFYRTDKDNTTWTIVNPNVVGTTMDVDVDSRDHDMEEPDQVSGRHAVTSSANRLRIDIEDGSATGHFTTMDFDVQYFTP